MGQWTQKTREVTGRGLTFSYTGNQGHRRGPGSQGPLWLKSILAARSCERAASCPQGKARVSVVACVWWGGWYSVCVCMCVCVCVRERERQTDRDRQTDREYVFTSGLHSPRFNRDKGSIFSIHSNTRWSKRSSWHSWGGGYLHLGEQLCLPLRHMPH